MAPTSGTLDQAPVAAGIGLVPRRALVEQLLAAGGAQVVSITAPAGYGKTALLEEWAATDSRPFAGPTVAEHDDARDRLRRRLAGALEQAGAWPAAAEGTVLLLD